MRTQNRATNLFETIKSSNPYATELDQVKNLFSIDLESDNDIDLLLYGLKDVFGYEAFDTGSASQTEVDDLANRLKNYRDSQNLLHYENDLITANLYCNHHLIDHANLKEVHKAQQKVCKKLSALQPFVDSNIKLKTELIGKIPPEKGETGTIGSLIHEYSSVYIALHDSVSSHTESCQKEIQSIIEGSELEALRIMENISILLPAISENIEEELIELKSGIFKCPDSSRRSVEEQIKRGPVHECGLTFANAQDHLSHAKASADSASDIFNTAFDGKLEIFLNPTVRKRLKQGESEKVIKGLLQCDNVREVRTYLVKMCLDDPSIVDVINRYLKRIIVKNVKMSDFKPTATTVEKEQIQSLAQEFEKYLEDKLNEIEIDENTLPMLKLE